MYSVYTHHTTLILLMAQLIHFLPPLSHVLPRCRQSGWQISAHRRDPFSAGDSLREKSRGKHGCDTATWALDGFSWILSNGNMIVNLWILSHWVIYKTWDTNKIHSCDCICKYSDGRHQPTKENTHCNEQRGAFQATWELMGPPRWDRPCNSWPGRMTA